MTSFGARLNVSFKDTAEKSSTTARRTRRGAIGIKYPVTADGNFFPARRYGRGRRLRIVRAARAMKQFGIEVEETIRFENVRLASVYGEPTLVLDLDEQDLAA